MTVIRPDFIRDIERLRDEIAVELVSHQSYSKELSLAVTRLEEAALWVIAHGRRTGVTLVIDKREYARNLEHTKNHIPKTDGTVETERGVNV